MRTDNFWRDSKDGNVVWVSRHRVNLAEFEADYVLPHETMDQGRSATNPVPRFSPLAGLPERSEAENTLRAGFWAFYLAVLLTLFCVVLIAIWPN